MLHINKSTVKYGIAKTFMLLTSMSVILQNQTLVWTGVWIIGSFFFAGKRYEWNCFLDMFKIFLIPQSDK
jgi:hypothetical protein